MEKLAPTLWEAVGIDPGAIALEDGRRSLTWAELESRTNRIGHGIEALGLAPGSHVIVMARNRHEWVEALIGAMRAGMIVTPVKTSWTADEVAYVMRDARTRAIVTDVDPGRTAAADLGLATVDLDDDFEAWLATNDDGPLPDDRQGWRMSYTSGTTGRPKGVRRFIDGASPWLAGFVGSRSMNEVIRLPERGVHLNVSALFHGAPLAFSISLMAAGVTFRMLDRWDAETAFGELQRGVTSTIMVPTMFRQLLNLPADLRATWNAPGLEAVLHGGEPCPRPLKQAMIDWWGPIFAEYYGMTEGGMCIASTEEWLARPGTVGRPTRGMGCLILDDAGTPVATGEQGTIYFQPPGGQFFEYTNEPGKTAAAHTSDGTAFTVGDIGYLDDDGYLYISGRTADVIVSSGVNVYPAEIENVLGDAPELRDAGCAGGPDDLRGEIPVVFVVPAVGCSAEAATAAVLAIVEAKLAGYQRPRKVIVRDALPRDPTGKLLRHLLRAELWAGRESNFAAPAAPAAPGTT